MGEILIWILSITAFFLLGYGMGQEDMHRKWQLDDNEARLRGRRGP